MLITRTSELAAVCRNLRRGPFVALDTEFVGEHTYYPRLCLVQLAGPEQDAVAVDPLASGLELEPLYELLACQEVEKVLHSARQDLGIFHHLTGTLPTPVQDTQVVAMVCGHGDSVGFHALVQSLLGLRLDKGSQRTDWGRRPLSDRQLRYALDDARYLIPVHQELQEEVQRRGRAAWVAEEMGALLDPATYVQDPRLAYQRLKLRRATPRSLALLRELAAWREERAQAKDLPRSRILRDDVVVNLAQQAPRTPEELEQVRGLPASMIRGSQGRQILEAITRGQTLPPEECPSIVRGTRRSAAVEQHVSLLQALLRLRAREHEVAARLVGTREDLESLAQDPAKATPIRRGWRWEIFGRDAVALLEGRLALTADREGIRTVPTSGRAEERGRG